MKTIENGQTWARAGLIGGVIASIAGNVANACLTQTPVSVLLRIPMAVIWPVFLFVAVEVLVRNRGARGVLARVGQVALLTVTVPTAITSFVNLHALMIKAGEPGIAQLTGPLAIDGLMLGCTIMMLATRVLDPASGQPEMANLATGQFRPWPDTTEMASMANHVSDPDNQMANGHLGQTGDPGLDFGRPVLATQPDDPTVDIKAELARWNRGYDSAIDDLGQELAGEAEAYANAPAVATRQENIPADAADLIVKMQGLNARPGQIDEAVAEMSGKSTRVARRWRIALKNREN
jgi:hypothetical protein